MATVAHSPRWIEVHGQSGPLVERLSDALHRALAERRAFYSVHIETVGRVGEVLVSISGSKGRLPLLFGNEELDPGFVFRVVKDTVARFDF